MRFGNFIEIGNDVLMHIIATSDNRFQIANNFDFDGRVRDRVPSRNPQDTREQGGEADVMWMLTRFGVDFRYQKSTEMQLVLEQRTNLDASEVKGRWNSMNPGGTSVFGTPASTENKGFDLRYGWVDYKFEGTPLRFRVGYDLWYLDQAGIVADNSPGIALFGNFGDFDVSAAARLQYTSQRLGLMGDNNFWFYAFSGGYNLRPHRFQLDVVYFRDRFAGADTSLAPGNRTLSFPIGFAGQKNDSVLIMGSWGGRVGPVRALVQGNLVTGTAKGANLADLTSRGLNGIVAPGRHYDILAGSAIAYGEVDLGAVRPFGMFLWGSADGDPTDHKLHGFDHYPVSNIMSMTGTTWFAHLDTSQLFARDYACPARAQGLGGALGRAPTYTTANPISETNNPGAPGIPGRTGTAQNSPAATANVDSVVPGSINPYQLGIGSLGGVTNAGSFSECSHGVTNPYNSALGNASHPGIFTTYSNPGTLIGFAGLRVFPLLGYELNAWYAYKGMVDTRLLEIAFKPELQARHMSHISKTQYHELGASVLWTLNPNFDIRLAGNMAFAGDGYIDLAHLANCNPGGAGNYLTANPCRGTSIAWRGELRFRGRF
jgi:hypothetical protein